MCEGGPLGSVSLPEDATDRGSEPAERPLSIEVLAALVALVAELMGERGGWSDDRRGRRRRARSACVRS